MAAESYRVLSIAFSLTLFPLHTLEFTSNNIQLIMSLDFIQYPSGGEITDPMREDPCCPPPLQLTDAPSSELFDQEFDNDDEVSEFYRKFSSEQIDALFSSRDTNPAISTKISTPSAFTNSTDSSHEFGCSQYSFNVTSSESDYLNPSEFDSDAHGSVNSSLYGTQAFISPAEFTSRLPYTHLNPAETMDGTMCLNSDLADEYSAAMQQLESVTCVDPAALTQAVHVISDSEVQMAPVRKPFKCPLCSFCRSEPMCICKLAHSSG
jgi:hypothetical protein